MSWRKKENKESKKLVKQIRYDGFLKSSKIEKSLVKLLSDKKLGKDNGKEILRFLMLEMKLAVGKGKEAVSDFQKLKKDWPTFSDQVKSQFASRPFDFRGYARYLGTYFNNSEFRKSTNFREIWKIQHTGNGIRWRPAPAHAYRFLGLKVPNQSIGKSALDDEPVSKSTRKWNFVRKHDKG